VHAHIRSLPALAQAGYWRFAPACSSGKGDVSACLGRLDSAGRVVVRRAGARRRSMPRLPRLGALPGATSPAVDHGSAWGRITCSMPAPTNPRSGLACWYAA